MAETKRTKAQIDGDVRAFGIALIDTADLTKVGSGTFMSGGNEVDGEERFYEIKVTVKKSGYGQDDIDALVEENETKRKTAEDKKIASEKKKIRDKERRANMAEKEAKETK